MEGGRPPRSPVTAQGDYQVTVIPHYSLGRQVEHKKLPTHYYFLRKTTFTGPVAGIFCRPLPTLPSDHDMSGQEAGGLSDAFTITLTDLPDDVLFHIFSSLTLRGVLRLEHLSQRFQLVISAYLSTLKTLNLYSQCITQDVFRCFDETVVEVIKPGDLQKLLCRCKCVQSIVYIPASSSVLENAREIVNVIAKFKNIHYIEFVDSKNILDEVRAQNVDVVFGEVCIASSAKCNLTSTLPPTRCIYKDIRALYVEGITLDSQTIFYFSNCNEMSLVKCNFEMKSKSDLNALEFPNLSRFVYAEQPGRSASSRVGIVLVQKATESEKLKVLHVGLSEFSALETAASSWKAILLEDLQVVSTGSYSASLQQLKYASVIANICHLCRASLKRISLPSSILIKRFFTELISANSHLQQLKTVNMTGLADTKMFLSPGNLVETFYYQEFLKLSPAISSLSLHSFTGSLVTLTLPLTLTELTLPWDNRLNLEKQRNEIVSTLSVIPQLHSLSILGVEEVDTLLVRHSRPLPLLQISIKTLKEFRLVNACIQAIVLEDCTSLVSFSIQCCPELQEINIPVQSLKKVCIYDDYRNYIDKFIAYFMASRSECSIEPSCHVHLQLHSVVNQEPDHAQTEHQSKANRLFSAIERECKTSSSALDCLVLKDNDMRLFEHNSGEHMYPFTEFTGEFASGRSDVEVRTEISRRERVFEGLNRWVECIMDVKVLLNTSSAEVQHCSELLTSNVTYCEGPFELATNLGYLEELSSSSFVCQPSGQNPHSSGTGASLNVPRIQPVVKSLIGRPLFDADFKINLNPLIIFSVIEYAHNIYTLFYYD